MQSGGSPSGSWGPLTWALLFQVRLRKAGVNPAMTIQKAPALQFGLLQHAGLVLSSVECFAASVDFRWHSAASHLMGRVFAC